MYIYQFLTRHKIIFTQQFGFRKKYSTAQTLQNICQQLMDALDSGNFACGVFIDLQKAFDTVDHEILLKKLFHYGIRGKPLNLLRLYFSNRQQFVSINGYNSTYKFVRHGVPQGSVLAPLLFLIYINNLHHAMKYSLVHHFADDTNLICFNKSLKSLSKRINIDLKLLTQWLNANKISLNASKTEYTLFRHKLKQVNYDFRIKMNGKRIFPSDAIKYLGIFLDSNLSWKSQISAAAIKLKRANGALSILRHYITQSLAVIFNTAVKSGVSLLALSLIVFISSNDAQSEL